MKVERSDVEFPLWRKKVDTSLFSKRETYIPNWVAHLWKLKELFGENTSRKNANSKIKIFFEKIEYDGYITYARYQKYDPEYKLFYGKALAEKLKDVFIMSYMRSLEQKLRTGKQEYDNIDIENEIPFWEFADLEFNSFKKELYFTSHYLQKPTFPELYRQFIQSHLLKELENKLAGKGEFKFIKGDWKPKSSLKTSLEQPNILYYLLDSVEKLLYIGEAENTKRLKGYRKEIPNWDYYRIEVLPIWLTKVQRLELERLIIRSYASILKNTKSVQSKMISEYTLMNQKIDS